MQPQLLILTKFSIDHSNREENPGAIKVDMILQERYFTPTWKRAIDCSLELSDYNLNCPIRYSRNVLPCAVVWRACLPSQADETKKELSESGR